MADVVVIAPVTIALVDGAARKTYETAAQACALLADPGDAVFISDGLDADGLKAAAAAVRARQGQTIEVRSERWDGESESPLSAACRGVVSGFGAAGVLRAIEVLSRPAQER